MRMRTIECATASLLVCAATAAGAGNGLGCDGDATRDGVVNTDDILEIVNLWGSASFDIDGDGICGTVELLAALGDWNVPCHPFHDVPGLSVELDYDAGVAIITSTNIPDHPTGPFDGSTGCYNPNTVTAQNDTWRIPLEPVPTSNPAVDYLEQMGQTGIMLSGATYYNPYDAGGIDAPSTICMDDFNGHPSPDGRYHYHQAPGWAYGDGDVGHSSIIGYSFDGYPVYGAFEATDVFAMDVTGAMALDACNGHEDEVRGYHYHAVAYDQRTDGFPWVQGCYRGEPDASNFAGGGGGGGGGCDGCAQNMIPPPVCNCVHTAPGYEYCCTNWDANCQAYAEQYCNGL